ncbi:MULTISPECIES: hypothetical protein [Bacillus cereus group]|uniref:hypothetical protein n=1 Tax=Bacillus cereus group TaxID=86661 RepID=UPI0010BEE11E|nr:MULTISPECIES: hypothetical protein [Bacillus cereus group]MBE7123424.1 hypothetical protein [Bacillus cereus]TKI39101.1 hypothetical protein FC700_21835 [Bacillus mycoides]
MFSSLNYHITNLYTNLYLGTVGDFKKGFGGNGNGSASTDSIVENANNLVKVIITLGGLWVVICFIFAGYMLAGSRGKSGEHRTAGVLGIVFAGLGGYVIVKAYDLAAWIVSL